MFWLTDHVQLMVFLYVHGQGMLNTRATSTSSSGRGPVMGSDL